MKEQDTPALIPKEQLPNCAVGETLKIVGEDDTHFMVEPEYEDGEEGGVTEPKPYGGPKDKMSGHAPAVAIVISGGKGGKPGRR